MSNIHSTFLPVGTFLIPKSLTQSLHSLIQKAFIFIFIVTDRSRGVLQGLYLIHLFPDPTLPILLIAFIIAGISRNFHQSCQSLIEGLFAGKKLYSFRPSPLWQYSRFHAHSIRL